MPSFPTYTVLGNTGWDGSAFHGQLTAHHQRPEIPICFLQVNKEWGNGDDSLHVYLQEHTVLVEQDALSQKSTTSPINPPAL